MCQSAKKSFYTTDIIKTNYWNAKRNEKFKSEKQPALMLLSEPQKTVIIEDIDLLILLITSVRNLEIFLKIIDQET